VCEEPLHSNDRTDMWCLRLLLPYLFRGPVGWGAFCLDKIEYIFYSIVVCDLTFSLLASNELDDASYNIKKIFSL
jgi:hypothetical protein